jgi:hypothetical protein
MRSVVGLALLALTACGPKQDQSPRTMRYAQMAIVGGLIGVLGTSLGVAATTGGTKDALIATDIGFGGVTAGALAVYLIADAYDVEPPVESAQQRADDEAWQMTKRAKDAARAGDCERVKKIAPTVQAKDASFYDVVFMRDAAIQKCLKP